MSQRMKIGGKWSALDMFCKVRGEWKPAEFVYVKVNGVWRIGRHIHAFSYVSDGVDTTHTATCAHCGKTITEGHIYYSSDGRYATCTEGGYVLYVCEICNQQKYVFSEALGHEWEDVVISEPTCTSGGEIMTECSRCGAAGETKYTDPLGHSFVAGEETAATCEEPGGYYETCYCGASRWVHTQDALGHDFVWDETMDCYVCLVCGYTE